MRPLAVQLSVLAVTTRYYTLRGRLAFPEDSIPATHYILTTSQQVYSFVPIPGAQQHKRPRRRYEEIERMYKCGWNGCEKAYGTLNHLNAHVTMQSHGQKRTPEGMYIANMFKVPIEKFVDIVVSFVYVLAMTHDL